MRRASRKKQDSSSSSSSREMAKAPTPVSGAVRRQHPPQEVLQQRKKHQDEVQGLTTKNYRLAKELADLRLKHRDEVKHVSRLTMENMNLASRCREAISHVAMLKKELAMQQKRTAQALASQREQTKRMADTLTNSFISFSSPDSMGESHHRTGLNRSSDSKNVGIDEDENVTRLVSSTPSPDRVAVQRHKIETSQVHNEEKQLHSKPVGQTSVAIVSTSSRAKKSSSSEEEARNSPATTATTTATSPTTAPEEEEVLRNDVPSASSSLSQSPRAEKNNPAIVKGAAISPIMYSTPKKSERLKSSSPFNGLKNGFEERIDGKAELFPISASPKMSNKTSSNRDQKTYDEGFPSDSIEQPKTSDNSKRKMNLINSIDAFEQSFSTDFPDSFTPKEGGNSTSSPSSGSGQKIYNPFFATPEKTKPLFDSSPYITSNQEKQTGESPTMSPMEFRTPPKNENNVPSTFETNDKVVRPRRPEKIIPPVARARYERASGPRIESSTQNIQPTGNEVEKKGSLDRNTPGALQRRMQQRKRLDKNLQSISNGSTTVGPLADSSPSGKKHQTRKDIVDIVDAFEHTESENTNEEKAHKSSTASRFSGPIKSLRRRSVNKPISYAEPPLNTKLRRGDTFFPKTRPDMMGRENAQNQVPNVIQTTTAVVSP